MRSRSDSLRAANTQIYPAFCPPVCVCAFARNLLPSPRSTQPPTNTPRTSLRSASTDGHDSRARIMLLSLASHANLTCQAQQRGTARLLAHFRVSSLLGQIACQNGQALLGRGGEGGLAPVVDCDACGDTFIGREEQHVDLGARVDAREAGHAGVLVLGERRELLWGHAGEGGGAAGG